MITIVNKEKYLETFLNRKLGEYSCEKYSHLLPLLPSIELASIAADLTGDGHLRRGLIQFISKEKYKVRKFKKVAEQIFDIKGKIRISPTYQSTYECLIGGNFPYKCLVFAGVPVGNKTNNEFLIPKWIIDGNKKIKSSYVRHLFDCEGTVKFQRKNNRIIIAFCMFKKIELKNNLIEFFNQIRKILSEFGIKITHPYSSGYNKRKDGSTSVGVYFEIQGNKSNLNSTKNFAKFIGFEDKAKKKKLNIYIRKLQAPASQCPGKIIRTAQLG